MNVKLKQTHEMSFRPDEWAIVTGVVTRRPDGLPVRSCYTIVYPDGVTDEVPIQDVANYELNPK